RSPRATQPSLGLPQATTQRTVVALARRDDRRERAVHADSLSRTLELAIAGERRDHRLATRGISALRDELGPRQGEPDVDVLGQPRSGAARIAGPIERGVRGDEAHDDRAIIGSLLRSEEHTAELQSRFDLVCR